MATIDPFVWPTMRVTYRAVFRANIDVPTSPHEFAREADLVGVLDKGPVEFSFTVPIIFQKPPAAGMTLASRSVRLPEDSYVIFDLECSGALMRESSVEASLRIGEWVSLFDIRYPGILSNKLFEGFIEAPGSVVFMPPGPLRLTAQPELSHLQVTREVVEDMTRLTEQPSGMRERFRLAARWFRRGLDTLDSIDKYLSWWTVLEIYPGEGDTDVVGKTRDLLHQRVYPELTPEEVKTRTLIGQLAGLRGDIIHQGKAFVSDTELDEFSDKLDRLEAIAKTCIRILAGQQPGDDLDKWVRDRSEPQP